MTPHEYIHHLKLFLYGSGPNIEKTLLNIVKTVHILFIVIILTLFLLPILIYIWYEYKDWKKGKNYEINK